MTDGFAADLGEALASAEAELGLGEPSVEETTLPVVESEAEVEVEQAPDSPGEQPTATDDAEEVTEIESFDTDDEVEETEEQTGLDPNSPELWAARVRAPNGEEVLLSDLWEGNLRQADYTRKTQELAEQRTALKDAQDFLKAFNEDPLGFARTLAVRAQLIEEGSEPLKELPQAQFRTPEEVEAEIERRVEEKLASDPSVQEAQIASARQQVNAEFDRIEETHGVKLGEAARQQIIDEAVRRDVADLELVFQALTAKSQRAAAKRGALKRTAPARAASSPKVGETAPNAEGVATDMADAMNRAFAELSTP